jgi:phosphoglucomutase
MKASPLAGKPPDPDSLVNVPKLITTYYSNVPDPAIPAHPKLDVAV